MFIDFRERERVEDREGGLHQCERETSIGLPLACTPPTGDQTRNLGMWSDRESNPQTFSLWTMFQQTEPHRPGPHCMFLTKSGSWHHTTGCKHCPQVHLLLQHYHFTDLGLAFTRVLLQVPVNWAPFPSTIVLPGLVISNYHFPCWAGMRSINKAGSGAVCYFVFIAFHIYEGVPGVPFHI